MEEEKKETKEEGGCCFGKIFGKASCDNAAVKYGVHALAAIAVVAIGIHLYNRYRN